MFDEDGWREAEGKVRDGVSRNMMLFHDALELARTVRPVEEIRERTATLTSVVASDGGHNTVEPFPFMVLGAIRVVDSTGDELFFDVIGPKDDTGELSARHLDEDTALGKLMRDLNVASLSDLSPMIPPSRAAQEAAASAASLSEQDRKRKRRKNSSGWMTVYRDLCEWAALYDLIMYRDPMERNTVVLRDGLLRSKIFRGTLFVDLGRRIDARIREVKERRKRNIYLVGIAKKSEVQARFALALQMLNTFKEGAPRFAEVPMPLQDEVYVWPEYTRLPDDVDTALGVRTPSMEEPKFNIGAMHFVRFGPDRDDPLWTVDTLHWQKDQAADIFGSLLRDTDRSFPIPGYPQSLILADEGAQITDLDAELLRDWFMNALAGHLDSEKRKIMESQVLNVDYAARRYTQ